MDSPAEAGASGKQLQPEVCTRVVSQVSGLDELGHSDTNNVDFVGRHGICSCCSGASGVEKVRKAI